MDSIKVRVGTEACSGSEMLFFVRTGSNKPPIGCLAANAGFPHVRDAYFRAGDHEGDDGVIVHIRFEGAAIGNKMAVDISQPSMPGDGTVIPLI